MVAWTGNYFSVNGQVLDGRDPDGTKWGITDIQGWDGATDPTLTLEQRARSSGATGGDSFSGPRTIAISGWVTVPSPVMLSLAADKLNEAASRSAVELVAVEEGRTRFATVQRRRAPIFLKRRRRYATWSISISSKDWRKFGVELSASTFLPSTSGGLVVPFTVPFVIGATLVNGQVNLTNPGNEVGPVRLRIDGPATGPVVTHVGSGKSLVFSTSLVLAAGEWLDIDMDLHTVLANGQASRSAYLTSRGWSGFDPGANTWALTAAVYDAATKLTVYAKPADE